MRGARGVAHMPGQGAVPRRQEPDTAMPLPMQPAPRPGGAWGAKGRRALPCGTAPAWGFAQREAY